MRSMTRSRLASIPRRVAWYPGSGKKYATFKSEFQDAEELGIEVTNGQQHAEYHPWLLRANLRPEEVRSTDSGNVDLKSHLSNSPAPCLDKSAASDGPSPRQQRQGAC